MHHRMPPSKTGCPSLNVVIFSARDSPRPGRHKIMTTPEIIDQIQELILEECRISATSIAEQLGTSRERVGSNTHEDLDMQELSAKWVPKCLNVDQKCQWWHKSEQIFEIFSARSKWFPLAIGDHGGNLVISLWPGDKATINGVAVQRLTPPPKIPSAKIRWKSYRLDFLESKRHSPHWLSSKAPNFKRGVLLISAGATEWHFEGKTPQEDHQWGSCSCTMPPAHRALANPHSACWPAKVVQLLNWKVRN